MPSFYKAVEKKQYKNVFYALNIAIDDYFSRVFLEGDSNRIVYSSTEYALIKRSGTNTWNNANLPFINYKLSGKTNDGARNWFSFSSYSSGLYVPELRKKLKITPVSFEYDCSYWTSRDDDYQYVSDLLLIDNASETKLEFYLDYEGILIKNIAIVDFNLDTSQRFSESDWLEKNNIFSIGLNQTVQTFIPIDNTSGFCIPKKILFDFCVKKNIINGDDESVIEHEELMEFVVDHFNKKITIK